MSDIILTDGAKAVNILNTKDPSVWSYFSGRPQDDINVIYSKVSAAYRAFNIKANIVASIPFAILSESGEEVDNSKTWQNTVGFLPNPTELIRLATLSCMFTNAIYQLRTMDVLQYRQKGLYHAVPVNFEPVMNASNTDVEKIERRVGTKTETYKYPKDPRLIRMWRLDHTTELLPSKNTEARAIMNAAGIVYESDLWIKHFFERGGVPPTVIAMKGAVNPDKRETEEDTWGNWLMGLGRRFAKRVRVVNAEALDVKQFGSSVTDLKDDSVYKRSIEGIAMGTGMPMSLLLANSANYATAKEEKSTWFETDIIPFIGWFGYEWNEQVFKPLGYRIEFRPETLDPQQEDETERANSISVFMDFMGKCPTFDVFMGACETFGYELSDKMVSSAKTFYADKEKREQEERELEMQKQEKPVSAQAQEEPEDEPVKWVPSLDEFKELDVWRDVTLRRLKNKQGVVYDYEPHYGGLPEIVTEVIKARLAEDKQWTAEAVKAAFDVQNIEAVQKSEIEKLAESIERLIEKGG